ncbi:uncharacterized protein MKK02DRAFT_39187 [Dioszegia hungarica]|uniref:Uncharacterized protein n=1 Tax=Dioszegia hungarica TaxID=4972 RepID=A0AA38LS86_9TREE|nr:uncharacterized protein MKK02DRAFT_39187 [Dioszegia hungarica]KAI9633208.1 hypothetical protein MKK02DRAFT_39187 [Dioszegia hungarica]
MSAPHLGAPVPDMPPAPPAAPRGSRTYVRGDLLALARSSLPRTIEPPSSLNQIPELLRMKRHGSDASWGEDESTSDLLTDDAPSIARALLAPDIPAPTEHFRIVPSSDSISASDLLFDYSSLHEADAKPPVLIDFADPFGGNGANGGRRASNAFQSFPPLVRSDSAGSDSSTRAIRLGESFSTLRLSTSGSSSSLSSSFSCSPVLRKASLNPYAAPFPLPATTPNLTLSKKPVQAESGSTGIPSLPLPLARALPGLSSLPAKPGPPPPFFVKKEAATLPQPMALPDIKPMGSDWLAEEAMSGNERRRRASQMGLGDQLPLRATGSLSVPKSIPSALGADPRFGSQSMGEKRPERLVKLGQSLRQSIANKGQRA